EVTMDAVNEKDAAPEPELPPLCPSAQPFMEGAFAFGVVQGPASERRVAYLEERVPVTEKLLALSGPVKPTEVFRFAAPCAGGKCQHYDGHDCQLANKLVQLTPAVTKALPACTVRPDCRWWRQEGKTACMRCPGVRTINYLPTEEQRKAADPAFHLAGAP
ncbi:MAG TPA: hypothetical protein VFQ39_02335, partial [Longimicrobium sp.]|nr:hypothetical protein [Longimicrobium sp.]